MNMILMLTLLYLFLMFFGNEGKPDIPQVATAKKTADDLYCATLDETGGKRYLRDKRSPIDDNITESAFHSGNTELKNETEINIDTNNSLPISGNTSVNSSIMLPSVPVLNSSDTYDSSNGSRTTQLTQMAPDLTNSTMNITEAILDGTNVSSIHNETSDNSKKNTTQSELIDINNGSIPEEENFTQLETKITNTSNNTYSIDANNILNLTEQYTLTNVSAETPAADTSNDTFEIFTTEETVNSTSAEGNTERKKRDILNLPADESVSNRSITQYLTGEDSINLVHNNNDTNPTESIQVGKQNLFLNSTDSDYNATEKINSLINSTHVYTNKSETNITVVDQITTENNATTNTTYNITVDANTITAENIINITDSNNTGIEQKHEVTNNLTELINSNMTITNSMDRFLQNVSNGDERPKRGIDSIIIHSSQNVTNMNTTGNAIGVIENCDLQKTESSLVLSTSQSTPSQTEKVCLIQGEECTNSTECCENFECTMFDFIKWSKNCAFKPTDIWLTSPAPDVRIPKQPVQIQPAV